MDSVEVISIPEEESNMITSTTSVLRQTSSLNIVRKESVKTLNSFRPHLMVVCHTMTNIPRVHFTKISSTNLVRFRLQAAGQSHREGGGGDYEVPVLETKSPADEGECSINPGQNSFPCDS